MIGALAVLFVVLTACGGSDDVEVTDDADAPAESAVAEPEVVEPEPVPEVEEPDDGGLAGHRPPPDAEELADCASIETADPGASIVFPRDTDPAWLDAGDGPVTVEIMGCSNTFEATVIYEAFHGDNRRPTLEGHTMGGTLGTWDRFSFEETFWTPGAWTIVVSEDDAESGERREYDSVTFEVG